MNISQLPNYKNSVGEIQMILESCQIGSISRITSLPNNFRARHWHPTDFHFCEVILGCIEYYENPIHDNILFTQKPAKIMVHQGDIIFTAPKYFHEMIFNCYTIFNCYSYLPRTQQNYEKETIRLHISLKEIYNNWKD